MDRRSHIDLRQNVFWTADDMDAIIDIVDMMTFTGCGPMASLAAHAG